MAKKNTNIIIGVGLILLVIFFMTNGNGGTQAVTGSSKIVRSITPDPIPISGVASISFTATDVSGKFGGIISETIPTGYSFNSLVAGIDFKLTGSLLEIPFTSTSLPTYRLNAPSSGATNIGGIFEFAEGGPSGTTIGETLLQVCAPDCSASAWAGEHPCETQMADGCGGTCTRTVTQNTVADDNCDDLVSNSELLVGITIWTTDTITNSELLNIITAWVNS